MRLQLRAAGAGTPVVMEDDAPPMTAFAPNKMCVLRNAVCPPRRCPAPSHTSTALTTSTTTGPAAAAATATTTTVTAKTATPAATCGNGRAPTAAGTPASPVGPSTAAATKGARNDRRTHGARQKRDRAAMQLERNIRPTTQPTIRTNRQERLATCEMQLAPYASPHATLQHASIRHAPDTSYAIDFGHSALTTLGLDGVECQRHGRVRQSVL